MFQNLLQKTARETMKLPGIQDYMTVTYGPRISLVKEMPILKDWVKTTPEKLYFVKSFLVSIFLP